MERSKQASELVSQLIETLSLIEHNKETMTSACYESLKSMVITTYLDDINHPNSNTAKTVDLSTIPTPQLMGSKIKNSGQEKVDRGVIALMRWNDNQNEIRQKIYISVRAVQELTGVRHLCIKEYFGTNLSSIEAHNSKHFVQVKYKAQYHNKRNPNDLKDKTFRDKIWNL